MTPMPRKDRPASAATNAGSDSEIETTIGATRLGSSSLNRIRRVGTPMTRAAWTNSRSRSESTSPRISRARPIQPKTTRIAISASELDSAERSWSGWSANR